MGKPQWREIGSSIIHPQLEMNTQSLAMVIAMVGTTIAPWMQFYMQSSVIEKGLKMKNYKYTMMDIIDWLCCHSGCCVLHYGSVRFNITSE